MPDLSASLDTAVLRKARGAFFTPEPLARYVTEWAVRDVTDKVLEPSCGEAAFLLSAVDRLATLHESSKAAVTPHLDGVELHEPSARAARKVLRQAGVDARVQVGDFFTVDPTGSYDVVIGNPPYVRYQDFSGEARARSREAALRAGVPMSGLASSWAAFTVHSALFLKKGGRLGLVLPAELLTVNYAAEVRRFLMQRFARVDLVLFEERVFPEAEVDAVLLMAEGYDDGPTDHCRIYQVRNGGALSEVVNQPRTWRPASPEAKWTGSLLSSQALAAYASLANGEHFTNLESWGDTTLGMVTGNNRYFTLSPGRVRELGLTPSDLIRLSPPGSRHLRGLSFTDSAWQEMGAAGSPTYLFRPAGAPSAAAEDYIAAGEAIGVERAYKCRVRSPWWRVPLVRPADLFLTYMNADTPRLSTNRAKAHHLNSVHGVYLKPGRRALGMDLLPLAALNSMTLLGAETVGRAYGGGMLKIEPREADVLPVPSPALLESARKDLAVLRPQVAAHLRYGRLLEAVRLMDDVLLVALLGISAEEAQALRDGHATLMARRLARGGKGRS
ncbi:HsdM family class I SAM-dependent methyltransferase [Kribbella sp. NPDC055071]